MGSTRNGSGVSTSQKERVRQRLRRQMNLPDGKERTSKRDETVTKRVAKEPEGGGGRRPRREQTAAKRVETQPGGGGRRRRKREATGAKEVATEPIGGGEKEVATESTSGKVTRPPVALRTPGTA